MQSDEGKPQERSQPRPTVGNGEAEEEDSFINISANVTKDDWDIADIRKKIAMASAFFRKQDNIWMAMDISRKSKAPS